MSVAWYLGFGWYAIGLFLLFGALSYRFSDGVLHWLLYGLFALVAAYMATKFRLYWREPWRRLHRKGMGEFAALLQCGQQDRVDFSKLYVQLGDKLLGKAAEEKLLGAGLLTEAGMRAYYRQLVQDFPMVFTYGLAQEQHEAALRSLEKDIQATEVGPEAVVAAAIEARYGRREAARYLLALARGLTRQTGLFN